MKDILNYKKADVNFIFHFFIIINTILWPFQIAIFNLSLRVNIIFSLLLGLYLFFSNLMSLRIRSARLGLLLLTISTFTAFNYCDDGYIKYLITTPILIIYIYLCSCIGNSARPKDWHNLTVTAKTIITVVFLGLLIEYFMPSNFESKALYQLRGQYSGFYPEPSALAYSVFPFLFLLLESHAKDKVVGIFFIICFYILSPSSTLLACSLIWGCYRIIVSQNKVFLFFILAFLIYFLIEFTNFFDPLIDRLSSFFNWRSSENLSSIIYIGGVEDTLLNLKKTWGLGLGANMMGCNPLPASSVRNFLLEHYSESKFELLNIYDGSFLAAKIISEFGLFGILTLAYFLKLATFLRNNIRSYKQEEAKFIAVIYITCLITFFIRSAGYFSGVFILFLTAYFSLLNLKENK